MSKEKGINLFWLVFDSSLTFNALIEACSSVVTVNILPFK